MFMLLYFYRCANGSQRITSCLGPVVGMCEKKHIILAPPLHSYNMLRFGARWYFLPFAHSAATQTNTSKHIKKIIIMHGCENNTYKNVSPHVFGQVAKDDEMFTDTQIDREFDKISSTAIVVRPVESVPENVRPIRMILPSKVCRSPFQNSDKRPGAHRFDRFLKGPDVL